MKTESEAGLSGEFSESAKRLEGAKLLAYEGARMYRAPATSSRLYQHQHINILDLVAPFEDLGSIAKTWPVLSE